jgi:hypothetical protein
LEAILQIQLFPPFLPCAFYLVKKNCIISKLNSDWLILIKVYPSFKKNRMRFYSIKVLQSFLWPLSQSKILQKLWPRKLGQRKLW